LRPVSKKLCDVINLWEQELFRSGVTKVFSVTHKVRWARTLMKSMLDEEISEVPELLRPYLLRLAGGQSPSSLLFGYGRTGMPRTRTTMWATVRKLCALAGVPPVCTRSLRGLYATLAVQSGSASHVVASSLGHGSFEVTQRHYAQASSVANASTARVLSILDSPMQGEEQAIARVADLCADLERPVLLRLAQLLAQSYESLESKRPNSAIDPQSIREPKMKDAQRRELALKSSNRTT